MYSLWNIEEIIFLSRVTPLSPNRLVGTVGMVAVIFHIRHLNELIVDQLLNLVCL